MGSAQDIMQVFAQKELRTRFPNEIGWKYDALPWGQEKETVFRVTRHIPRENPYALVAMFFGPRVSGDQIAALKKIPRDGRSFQGYSILVPQNTDVSCVPDDVSIFFMKAFGIVDGRLSWLTKKKNAVQFTAKEQATA